MEINLAREKPIYYEVGTKVLTESELRSLADGNTTSGGVVISSGQTMSVVCDLGARYNLVNVYYYRARASADIITIYGRQAVSDSWTELTTSVTSTYHLAQLSGVDRYRQIRVVHLVSSGSATARELEVYTEDDAVAFGSQEQGSVTEYSIDSGTEELVPLAVYIKNTDSITRDFYVLIDATDADGSDYKLSATKSGTYYPIYEKGLNLPRDFSWSSGQFTNTAVFAGDVVKIVAGLSGTYHTPVLDLNGVEGRRFFWRQTISGTNEVDIDSQVDSAATVQVRMSNTTPTGSWTSGQLSTDSLWSVVSGSLPYTILPNNAILDPSYRRYFQARVEFHTTVSGQTPILQGIGIESGFKVTVSGGMAEPVYAKSANSNNNIGDDAALICWTFEDRTS